MKILSKLANLWVILVLLALFLLANFVVIPALYPKFQTLDTLTSYSPSQAYQLLDSYSPSDRQAYTIIEFTLDLVYPFTTALMFSLLILASFRQGFPAHPGWQKLALLPFAILLADYLENICVIILLLAYPAHLLWLTSISNIFTVAKFFFTPLELIFVVGLVVWLLRAVHILRPASGH